MVIEVMGMSVLEEAILELANEKCKNLQLDQLERFFFDTPEIEKQLKEYLNK